MILLRLFLGRENLPPPPNFLIWSDRSRFRVCRAFVTITIKFRIRNLYNIWVNYLQDNWQKGKEGKHSHEEKNKNQARVFKQYSKCLVQSNIEQFPTTNTPESVKRKETRCLKSSFKFLWQFHEWKWNPTNNPLELVRRRKQRMTQAGSAGAENPRTAPLVPGWGWQHQQPWVNYF